ncbi:hypothetical protein BGX26_011121 [Mortierella sp. AD094]|nr:hypothetical protein BGX26_011121 [Mortierella sp. AD094]
MHRRWYVQDTCSGWLDRTIEDFPSDGEEEEISDSDGELPAPDEDEHLPPPPPPAPASTANDGLCGDENDPVIWECGSEDEAMEAPASAVEARTTDTSFREEENDPVIWEYGSEDDAMIAQSVSMIMLNENSATPVLTRPTADNQAQEPRVIALDNTMPEPEPETAEVIDLNNRLLKDYDILTLDPDTVPFSQRVKETPKQRKGRKETYIQWRVQRMQGNRGRARDEAGVEFERRERRRDREWVEANKKALMNLQKQIRQQLKQLHKADRLRQDREERERLAQQRREELCAGDNKSEKSKFALTNNKKKSMSSGCGRRERNMINLLNRDNESSGGGNGMNI